MRIVLSDKLPTNVAGEHGKGIITLNRKLGYRRRLAVLAHEFVHYLHWKLDPAWREKAIRTHNLYTASYKEELCCYRVQRFLEYLLCLERVWTAKRAAEFSAANYCYRYSLWQLTKQIEWKKLR